MTPLRRILVVLTSPPGGRLGLEVATKLATAFRAELHGLYLEDIELVRGAGLPFTTVVDSISGAVRSFGDRELLESFAVEARQVRRELEGAAERAALRSTFRVVRGLLDDALGEAEAEADLIVFSKQGTLLQTRRALGRTSRLILERTGQPVLFLDGGNRQGPVLVLYDATETSSAALEFGLELARAASTPLIVLGRIADLEQLRIERVDTPATAIIDRDGNAAVETYPLPFVDANQLRRVARLRGASLLLLGADPRRIGWTERLIVDVALPVLVMRQPSGRALARAGDEKQGR